MSFYRAAEIIVVSLSAIIIFGLTLSCLPQRIKLFGSTGKRPDELSANELYEDEDGVATPESMARYIVRPQKIVILLAAFCGLGFSLASGINATVKNAEPKFAGLDLGLLTAWIFTADWLCMFVQAIFLYIEKDCGPIFGHCRRIFSLSMVLLSAQAALLLMKPIASTNVVEFWLPTAQIASVLILSLASAFIPRRPDVYFDGHLVDGMRTGSLFSRYTFYWGSALLKKAAEKGHLNEDDLPGLDRARRAERLLEEFNAIHKSPDLYWQIFKAHWRNFMRTWIATLVGVMTTFTPPVILNRLLFCLERRDKGESDGNTVWFWVAALGIIKLFEAVLLAYVYWVCFMGLMIPIRNQLSAVVFSKTFRKKDVKGLQKESERNDQEPTKADEDEVELQNMKQGAINLLAVDSDRIALFCAMSNVFVESFFGTMLGFVFVVFILGWQSLLAGILVIVLTTPMNIYSTKKYSKAQDELMQIRDKKMAVVSEALQGIRQIKFSALEDKWEDRIRGVREEELRTLRTVVLADVTVLSVWVINPIFLSATALSVYAIIHGSMSPSVAFSALAVFGELEWTLSIVPEMVTDAFDALVSVGRIKKYLDSAEKEPIITDSSRIAMVDATVAWAADTEDETDRFCLRNINLEFPLGELSLVSGRTGSGKSLLLSALLGEADLISGRIEMPPVPLAVERFDFKANPSNWILPNAVAYVSQIPWIENGSIRDNIVFGLPFNEPRYNKTLDACALTQDMESLSDGDRTEIGSNGINLSGGQRWRVSFARAAYSRAGILILDDIFSAVDAHVGKQIFENGLTGELMHGRTRILVTHHLKLCISQAAYAVFLQNGSIENAGAVAELQERGILERIIARAKDGDHEAEEQIHEEENELKRSTTRESNMSRHADHVADTPMPTARQFIQDEERERGAVKWSIYNAYLDASGGLWVWILAVSFFASQEALTLGKQYWIKIWTSQAETSASVLREHSLIQYSLQRISAVIEENHSLVYWIGTYTAISLVICIVGTAKYAYVYLTSLRASRGLFENMLRVILRAPLRWLDTVPTGRILNRFNKDFETVDSRLANDIAFLFWNIFGVIGVNLAAVYLSPYIMVIAIIGLAVNVHYAVYYLAGAREVKRLESNSRSPIFELFGATLSGVATIRAFGRVQEYTDKMFSRLDVYHQRTFYNWLFNRWVGLRMCVVGAVFAMLVGTAVTITPGIDAALAGFALSFALNYTGNVIWALRRYANMELDMNSTERIVEYTTLPIEDQGGVHPPAAWPTEGRVEVEDLVVSYAPELPPVLKGISFDVKPRERIGIVGRTGAGKSSLTLALFQFIRASSGSIFIDGIDISKINLRDLRSRLAIIPQDPVLFSGTIRSNLDTFNEYSDEDLQEALQRVHLVQPSSGSESGTATPGSDDNANVFASLDSKVSEGGLNLSQGQRQLLCLARAIVSRPKILVLDEATSAVDMETDALIQKSIREEFTECSTLVIAHRLQTVVDYDRILVLGDGKVLEFDSPWNLILSKGAFYDMVQHSGEAEALEVIARKAAEKGISS
ncbi:P-loop containing nucleoside triphosphate hydrolase protein [Sphaerosporella brunnea]|uniref:P-loop containing nucleoside triphosphate hydrolase protein n=1 Tax=Sphaerosporella brunnea TaxID=1250544 RepID=A0A5J5EIA2_9PEZI|nr:P-loop containing nucleoside triphosphate hydrolase protein [Sphaerosporella brunnea]